ncbi:MAG: hypothetical protein JSV62_04035 [Promethearchaeota archaeon]|nr:MAG: hypothetical protein JSV62_04035 [Candidatus Lokiarchaeota archaeon]
MTLSPQDYERILEDTLKQDLEWLVREFTLIFKYKNPKTKEDIQLGNQILEQFVDNIKNNNSEESLNLLAITLARIENEFPEFF